ncbi:enoyl-ACP reductase FabI [Streptomyces sp. ISL-43]|uniref:enoyl-ACP reductase FabI n=1 Tax=Streptomyces sp. ISL-43 TaxID=2819183 RepID=UPI001BE91311|nr:enoyl-ACP reductase FabI [Streptomyces sp. ISL-43]MBT2449988.1 enoyl-ACP reductase FabI [Streptomyces sp. ISL-43]
MSGILDGKRILVTGMLTEQSIAFHAAKVAQEEGAEVILTGFGRMTLVERTARLLPKAAPVIELDVTSPEQLAALAARISDHAPSLDGIVHSVAFGPRSVFDFLAADWDDVATAVQVSAFSYKALVTACLPLMRPGASVVGLTFDAGVTWPHYDWMGVAKAALESTNRYLARDLGDRNIRCNLIAAGPLLSMAAKSIPGFGDLAEVWEKRSALSWNLKDPEPVGRGVVGLLSDFFPQTTGEIIHVDGGVHMMGA